jgi:hypothetical protein
MKSPAPFQWAHKRIVAEVLVLAAIVGLLTVGARFYLGCPANRINSIAVLPLEDLCREPEPEYFANGMMDAFTTDLSKRRCRRSRGTGVALGVESSEG